MRENTIRSLFQRGTPVVNGWLTIPSSWSAEVMAHQGWDSLTVDTQHGLIDYQTAFGMLQAISTTPVIPLARAPWNEPGILMKLLDAGAYGIICPMINTRAQAEAFVGACRYAPQGYRSAGPLRAQLYGGPDYIAQANAAIVLFAMIETAEALANVDDIAATPGLDGLYIGPSDLGLSLTGRPGVPTTEPPLSGAIAAILAAAQRAGKIPGMHTASTEEAKRMIAKGFRFVTVLSDTRLLQAAAQATVAAMRAAI
jgi:4-hydroxy-2-oxoheptanedioate aldolase